MENKMVEPSNKKVIMAFLGLLGILFAITGGAWAYIHRFSTPINKQNNEVNEPTNAQTIVLVPQNGNFEVTVPSDWTYSSVPTEHFNYDVYIGPLLPVTPECTALSEGKPGKQYYNRLEIEVVTTSFTGTETFESFMKFFEVNSQPDRPNRVIFIEQFEVGGKSNLSVYQFPSLEKCSINRFEGVAQTLDGKLFKFFASGPSADYQVDFKDIFHSIKLK